VHLKDGQGVDGMMRKGPDKVENLTPLTEGDFFHTSSNFLQKKGVEDYEGITAPAVSGNDGPKARKIIFNILDVNMDGHLTLSEFFDMIKFFNVFTYMAGDK